MNKCKFLIVLILVFVVATLQVQAEKYKGPIVKKSPKADANCFAPAKNTNLALNNVRAYLKTNGTLWFDEKAEYEIPKGSGKTSLFSSSLWIGGKNKSGNLHMAAMRFAQVGNDYWTGPLHTVQNTIDPPSCSFYDKFYTITRTEVERHILAFRENDGSYSIPKSIAEWPAHGRADYGESRYLAPFYSEAGNTIYDPEAGDYPYYDLDNILCPWTLDNKEKAKKCVWLDENLVCNDIKGVGIIPNSDGLPIPRERVDTRQDLSRFGWDNKMIYADHVLKGDETVYWFLNDKGGPHTETGGNPIGLEIRVQAFAFSTNDELNKMTFYSYEIINRGDLTLYDTYFSQWCDPDLGYAYDDFIGCDVIRGLGYCYNGREIDGNGEPYAYGENPPAVGLDFFQGPYIDPDGADNPRFIKEYADINGNSNAKAYCERFVNNIFDYWREGPPSNLYEFTEIPRTFVIPNDSTQIDSVRWNDQFAINGVNFGDGIVDNERFGMRAFTYHNNMGGVYGDPTWDFQYYNFLTGKWGSNGVPFTYGGTGYDPVSELYCDFVFPKGTDYCNWGTKGKDPGGNFGSGGRTGNWSEMLPNGNGSAPNEPHDRRFMQSAGPFTLEQGACNYITVGIPWARSMRGGVQASIDLLMVADDKCQALFENCFKMLDGPDAPTLTIREYDQKLILLLTNSPLSNNANEDYIETDLTISETRTSYRDSIIYQGKDTITKTDTIIYGPRITILTPNDREYRFEGYQIYQVTGPEVGANDIENPDLARLIRQYDIENYEKDGSPIGRLINWEFDEDLQISIPKEKVWGSNTGIEHSFEVTQDVFASGNKQLVNYKTYYFIAVAYAYNQFLPFTTDPDVQNGLLGQKLPYLRGRKTPEGRSVTPVPGIPHPPTVHGGGATMNSDYGTIPPIIRIDGQGNGGIALDLKKETIDKIMAGGDKGDWRVRELKYEKDAGPLNIKVIDPLRVRPFDFTLIIKDLTMENDSIATSVKNKIDVSDDAYWVLTIDETVSDEEIIAAEFVDKNDKPIREIISQTKIGQYYEQIIIPLGISISVYNKNFVNRNDNVKKYYDKLVNRYKDMHKVKYVHYVTEKIDMNKDIVFENNGKQWITGLIDDNKDLPSNWIRAGTNNKGPWTNKNGKQVKGDYDKERLEDCFYVSNVVIDPDGNSTEDRVWKDPSGKFGTVCDGTWAPYILSSPYDDGPHFRYTESEPRFRPTQTADASFLEPEWGGSNGTGPTNYYNYRSLHTYMMQPGFNQTMTNLYSVNVVFTPDRSKWTRCVVLEACPDRTKAKGGALKGEPRKGLSVDKYGNHDNSTDGFDGDPVPGEHDGKGRYGMGWFPGYAINIETGERLNMMFSENSDTTLNNNFGNLVRGSDMIFNPTSTYAICKDPKSLLFPYGTVISKTEYDGLYEYFSGIIGGIEMLINTYGIERIWGGMHYVYVCNSSGNTSAAMYLDRSVAGILIDSLFLRPGRRNFNIRDTVFTINYPNTWGPIQWGDNDGYIDKDKKYPHYECGPYDEGEWLVQKFKQFIDLSENVPQLLSRKHTKMQLFSNVMYTHIPLQPEDPDLQKQWLSCDVTYKIRVTRPYLRYTSRWYETPELRESDFPMISEYEKYREYYEQYKGYPVYKLSTRELTPTFNDTRLYQSILDNINIVPNPYYGASLYESNALETMVKITNLPTDLKNNAPVTINIFTVSGILVRTLTKGDSETSYVNWDLKNYANIPIASGVYIIHVNCPGIGERMLKFFCAMRQTDLNSF